MKHIYHENVFKKALFLFFMTLSLGIFAQETVRGKVTSAQGEPLPGASIIQKGTQMEQ